MTRLSFALLALTLSAAAALPAIGKDVTIGQRTLQVPDGFEVELVAGPPLVERPISVAMDERGRLYVTDSGGMSEKAEKQLAIKPHRIRRLEDSDGDGRFDRGTMLAEKMMFPEGCMWFGGSVYVAAPPQIWKLTDADGDGVAEKRDVWFDGKTLTGCGNDLHGPYLGRDGWIYWCKGAFAEQTYTLPGGKQMVTRASHIFRAHPDGTGIEPVLTGGMDNPVGVAFLSTGERILSCTFFQQPSAGRRDGLIHAIYGGVYGKKHDVLTGHKMTGDVMPVLVHEGAAAPCGLMAASDSLFGGGFGDHVFACYFNLHKVVMHELVPDGATYKTKDIDLLACDHPDFHPTDVFEDADGSLLIVDTGGWYKVCCPTSVLAKPDVMGAIYRLRKTGQPKVEDPLGLKLEWEKCSPAELAKRLTDPRLFVRRRATAALRNAGAAAVEALAAIATPAKLLVPPAGRREAVWALGGIGSPAARAAVWAALGDGDATVQQAAIHLAGLWRDREALDSLLRFVSGDNAALARAAAEAIGRIGDERAVPELLRAAERLGHYTPDAAGAPEPNSLRVLSHSLTYAMIEIGKPQPVAAGLSSPLPQVRRAALVALDQMDDGTLRPEQVVPLLNDPEPILRNTAAWIVGHRPQWGQELVSFARNRLANPPAEGAGREALVAQLGRLAKSEPIQELLVTTLRETKDVNVQQIVLRAMAASGLPATPAKWLEELARLLPEAKEPILGEAVATIRALPKPKNAQQLSKALLAVGHRRDVPARVRLDALIAADPIKEMDADLLADLLAMVQPAEPMNDRGDAAAVLARATYAPPQLLSLAKALRQVGPLELPKILPAFEKGLTSAAVGQALVESLKVSPGRKALRPATISALLARFPPEVQQAGKELLAEVDSSAAEKAAHLDELLKALPKGDPRHGQEVFAGKKMTCAGCHNIGYVGGRLGPDLTNIGKTRTERDLLEAIVYPSASFVRGFEPVYVELRDGDKLVGIITSEAKDELVLATGPLETRRIPRKDIADVRPSPLSLMPDGMETALSQQELADVIAFLKQGQK